MNDKDEVLQVFNAIRNALMTNNTEALKFLFAEEYRGFNLRGSVDGRDLVLEYYKPGAVTLEQFEVYDLEIEVIGDVGIANGRAILKGRYKETNFEHTFRFLDIFVRRESGWKYYMSQATEIVKDTT